MAPTICSGFSAATAARNCAPAERRAVPGFELPVMVGSCGDSDSRAGCRDGWHRGACGVDGGAEPLSGIWTKRIYEWKTVIKKIAQARLFR
jgi:hypothetical protein